MDGEATRIATDLSRDELYALVWEKPLNRIGPELGTDGPRLAKLCDKRQVPYPPPGYWSKKAVGRAPVPTPLPDEHTVSVKQKGTRVSGPIKRIADGSSKHLPPLAWDHTTSTVSASSDASADEIDDDIDLLEGLHPKIKALIKDHKQKQTQRAQENRRRKIDVWSWSGPLLEDLTPRDLYRIRACSTLCHAIEKAGAKVKDADIYGKLTFTSQGRDIDFVIKEKMSRPAKRPDGEAAKWTAFPNHYNYGLTPSGWLRAHITTWLPGHQPQWIESTKKRFSALVSAIVECIIASVPQLIEWEHQRDEARRRYQAEEMRRWEERRLQEIDDGRWARFRTAAANWREMQLLNTSIAELHSKFSDEGDNLIGDKTATEWFLWARDRVLALDPLAEGIDGLFRDVGRP